MTYGTFINLFLMTVKYLVISKYSVSALNFHVIDSNIFFDEIYFYI